MAADERSSILVVEDEESLADSVRYNLEREGYAVEIARDGRAALERFRHGPPALVLLDLMLPEVSGLDVCRTIRSTSTVPIIMLTAKDAEADRVAGLEIGAHTADGEDEVLESGPVRLDLGRHEAWVRHEPVTFPPKEFDLLETFLRREGRLLTREFLIDEIWGSDYFGDTKTLDVHVKRIRKKVEADPHQPVHLVTVRGLGYKFVP